MKTTTLTVSTKKGESQTLRFLIVQEIPYPSITGGSGRIKWQNFGGLFDQYGRKADGIGSNYCCHLLADNCPEPVPDDYNRTAFAGYADYNDKSKVNGGTFKMRGRDLGEMDISFNGNSGWPEIKVNGFNAPSKSEREAITELICPPLLQFIVEHRAELKAEAVTRIKAKIASELREARASLDELEAQAEQAVI